MPMTLQAALTEGEKVLNLLQPLCEPGRIMLAGSIRRRCEMVSDIELVCVPSTAGFAELQAIVARWRPLKGDKGGSYTRRVLPSGAQLDLFMCSSQKWPQIAVIRTGCKDFSQSLAVIARQQGRQFEDGYLLEGGRPLRLTEERQVFDVLGLPWYEPHQRTPEAAKVLLRRNRAQAVAEVR